MLGREDTSKLWIVIPTVQWSLPHKSMNKYRPKSELVVWKCQHIEEDYGNEVEVHKSFSINPKVEVYLWKNITIVQVGNHKESEREIMKGIEFGESNFRTAFSTELGDKNPTREAKKFQIVVHYKGSR